jgi:uncharacterized membrane protein YkoI
VKDKIKGAVIALVAIVALAIGGAAIAGATGGDDDKTDKPIAGQALERAKAVALDHTGGGKVTGTEAGDEEGAYEVEVTLDDGRQVDVHLDERFRVLSTEGDSEDDDRGGDDD